MRSSGFLLIELILVIALGGIMALYMMPQFNLYDRMHMRQEIQALFLKCLALQRRAIVQGVACELFFDIPNNSYRIDNERFALPSAIIFGYNRDVQGPPATPTERLNKAVTFPGNRIVFYPEGSISAGSVYLKGGGATYALTVGISHVSYIRRYVNEDGSWSLW